jgi:hypothetical protein
MSYAMTYGYQQPYSMPQTLEAELIMLESYKEQLEYERESICREIGEIESRIEDLEKRMEGGTQVSQMPPVGSMTPWVPLSPVQVSTPEQERQMLEQRADELQQHIEATRKRLEEISKGE